MSRRNLQSYSFNCAFIIFLLGLNEFVRSMLQQRWRRPRKRHLGEFTLSQTLSRLFLLVQYVKCGPIFSWILKDCIIIIIIIISYNNNNNVDVANSQLHEDQACWHLFVRRSCCFWTWLSPQGTDSLACICKLVDPRLWSY